MSVELYRVDDRLIHGQVIVGWAQPLGIEFILLADDGVARSEWEQDLYRMGVPPEVEVIFASIDEAAAMLNTLEQDSRKGMVLTANISAMARLHELTGAFRSVNLGGIHIGPGRVCCLRYLYLSASEERELRTLASRGVRITAQDLPVAKPLHLDDILHGRAAS